MRRSFLKIRKSRQMARQLCVALLLLAFVSSSLFVGSVWGASEIYVRVDSTRITANNKLSLGFALGPDWKYWRDSATLRQLAEDANFKLVRFFSVRVEPCTYWYESRKTGTFNWANVDSLVKRIFETGAEPLISLGGCKSRGMTNLPRGMVVNSATGLPYAQSWAAYCAEWVRHFKAAGLAVRFYEIVNEPQRYFAAAGWNNIDMNKLRYFTDLFNAAATSMRQQNSKVMISHDFICHKTVLNYWLDHGVAVDTLNFHKYDDYRYPGSSDAQMLAYAESKFFGPWPLGGYSVTDAQQAYFDDRGKLLPIINSESSFNAAYESGTDPRMQKMVGAVWLALTLRMSVLDGVSYNLYYCFSSSESYGRRQPTGGAGFGMINSDNNKPWYPYYVQHMIGNNLAVGDSIVETTSSSSDVRTIAWVHNQILNVLLICKVDQPRTVHLDGLQGQINISKIDNTVSWKTPRIQTGTIDSTKPLVMNGYTVALLRTRGQEPSQFFQDGFESGDFSKWTGTYNTYGETTTVASYRPYSGNYHARFASNGGSGVEHAYSYKTIDMNEVYARGYFYVAGGLPLADNGDRFYFLRLRGDSQNLIYAGIRRDGGVDKWVIYGRNGARWMGWIYSSTLVAETSRWYCVELHWKKHSTAGLIELYVDGAKILEIDRINTAYYGNAKQVNFGLIYAASVQNSLIIYGDRCEVYQSYIGPESALIFQDDFESGDFGKWTGTYNTYGETTTVASYRPYSGNYHARFASNGGSGVEHAYSYKAVDEEKLHAGGYFRIVSGLPLTENNDRFYLIRFRAGGESVAGVGIRRYYGVERWMVYGRDGSSWVWPTYVTSPSIQMNRWYHIELYWQKDSSQGRIEVYIDGENIFEITGMDTSYLGNVDSIYFGLINAAGVQNRLIVYGDSFTLSNI